MDDVSVKFLICKYGKLLLFKDANLGKWTLAGGNINPEENLFQAANRISVAQTGWQTDNIRFFKLNSFINEFEGGSHFHEFVFIVDGVKNILPAEQKIKDLRWFHLNDLPQAAETDNLDREIIMAFRNLIHAGKTLDLELLPPAFNLKKVAVENHLALP